MNDLQIFKNSDFGTVRTMEQNDKVLFCGKDIAAALGYKDTVNSIKKHCRGVAIHHPIQDSMGRTQQARFITEGDVYRLIAHSKLPAAERFEHWVFDEVLPSIRKNGGYIAGQENMSDAELMAKALEVARRTLANKQAQIEHMQPKAVFADAVCASNTTILVGELAKILRQNGVDMGEKRLFDWLRQNGYLVRRNGTDRNMPTQRSMEQGLFVIKETTVCHSDGHTTISKTPKITGKGQQYFVNIFLRKDADKNHFIQKVQEQNENCI